MPDKPGTLVHAFWHHPTQGLHSYRHGGHAYLWIKYIGRYKVMTWTSRDGKPIATGWFVA